MAFNYPSICPLKRRGDWLAVGRITSNARAHCWFEDLISGRSASMVEIGKREKVGKRYVSRIIRLAFLAPDIVGQIASGCHPPELTAESLLKDRRQLPQSWESQHRMLGFPFPA